ncbi:glycoside hydrolase family 5 protein [Kitasatospora viridis]|uniref:Aryl-phospho-beta-D-glucosidase BglC (GH1 family) n=1 Tax=Kitasatospora viridis TaxID=281105 RepID=A0A561TSK5_9ACTN|nr:cellulase family glycosylhydrolase [Kitasatospora viridis]TWF90094.1 aryl-phospho-beta-D-glucosidase BglC (GH1 family) [Kitasatospora viridis]
MRPLPNGRTVRRRSTRLLPAVVAVSALVLAGAPGTGVAVASTGSAAPTVLTGKQLSASWQGPLSTRGRYIVDAHGNRFKLKAGNWDGSESHYLGSGDPTDPANNQAGEVSNNIPMGLDRAPIASILADFHRLGLNSIRLPFANAMIHDDSTVPDSAVRANPQLRGKTPLEVYDAVVKALTGDGFAVILNNHTTTYHWCCGLDGNERWDKGQSTQQWEDDWLFLVDRYKDNKRVVGADLRNEVRRDGTDDPNWGWNNDKDEYAAFEEAGNKILQDDPDMLIIMEGINWQGIPQGMFPHGRPMLTPVRTLSNTLIDSGKLVYSAHFYGFTGPNHTGATGGALNGETNDPRYRDLSPDELEQAVNDEALFVTQAGQHFTAPVWVSEFGTAGRGQTDAKEKDWFDRFTGILEANDTDFAIWPLIGWTDDNGKLQDNWAALSYTADGKRTGLEDSGDWRTADWNRLINSSGKTGKVAQVNHWNMLNARNGDQDVSRTMLDQDDWSPGNYKGNCPDSQRLIALGRGNGTGLCTDAGQPAKGEGDWTVVTNWSNTNEGDWAGGYDKLQCPDNSFAVGFSNNGGSMAALLCAPSADPLPTDGRDVWFDHGDNRPSDGGSVDSDWASGNYKGQCNDDEYIAGVADTYRYDEHGVPDVLLCRPLD